MMFMDPTSKTPISKRITLFSFTALFVIIGITGIAFSLYLIHRAGSLPMYAIGIFFLLLSFVSGFFSIFTAYTYYRSHSCNDYISEIQKKLKPLSRHPTVTIAVPVFNENPSIVKKNLSRLLQIDYPRNRLSYYLLDDSTKADIRSDLERFCKKNGINYLHRDNREGFKGGAFNNMLKHAKGEFIALFDYDEYLINKGFLKELLPYFESDKNLSYVQTEKKPFYGGFFSESANLFDAFFFKFVQQARLLNNTAIFAGSCGIIRRSMLDAVGGFPEYVTEDTFFSFESDLHQYKGVYVPKIYAKGMPIVTFSALAKQQWRYNYGGTQFFWYFLQNGKNKKSLPRISSMDYLTHGLGLNYLSAVLILFTLASVLLVFFAFPFTHLTLGDLANIGSASTYLRLLGMLSLVLSLVIPIFMTKVYFKSFKKGLMLFALNFSLAFIRTKAALSAILHKDPKPYWSKSGEVIKNNLAAAIGSTRTELAFAFGLFALGSFAIYQSNIAGGIWLLWYGAMYGMTTVLFYKYG